MYRHDYGTDSRAVKGTRGCELGDGEKYHENNFFLDFKVYFVFVFCDEKTFLYNPTG